MSESKDQQGRILIIDDEEPTLNVMEKVLTRAGYSEIRGVTDPRRALADLLQFRPDLIVLDLHMPHLDGFAVLRQVQERAAPWEQLPVLVLSGDTSPEGKERALEAGAADFLAKPYENRELVLRVRNLLASRELNRRLSERLQNQVEEVRRTQLALADRLALAAELRDYGRGLHSKRVGHIAGRIAIELGLPEQEVELIARAAPLHDIGMIGIPDSIVLKPGDLTLEEWDVLKTHTTLGAKLLSGSDSPVLQLGEEIALYHHENWDGTGYIPGVADEEIPLSARITAVADVFDAMVHDRPYQHGWATEEAVEWIGEQKGRKFDPAVVSAFLQIDPSTILDLPDDPSGATSLLEPFTTNFSQNSGQR